MSEKFRLGDLKKGDVLLLDSPVRMVKVKGRTTIEVRKPTGIEQTPALEVAVKIPTMPIEGLINGEQAADNKLIAKAAPAEWTEVWAERSIHPVEPNRKHGGVLEINEAKWLLELACVDEKGRPERLQRTSPVRGQAITGNKLDRAVWDGIEAPVDKVEPANA